MRLRSICLSSSSRRVVRTFGISHLRVTTLPRFIKLLKGASHRYFFWILRAASSRVTPSFCGDGSPGHLLMSLSKAPACFCQGSLCWSCVWYFSLYLPIVALPIPPRFRVFPPPYKRILSWVLVPDNRFLGPLLNIPVASALQCHEPPWEVTLFVIRFSQVCSGCWDQPGDLPGSHSDQGTCSRSCQTMNVLRAVWPPTTDGRIDSSTAEDRAPLQTSIWDSGWRVEIRSRAPTPWLHMVRSVQLLRGSRRFLAQSINTGDSIVQVLPSDGKVRILWSPTVHADFY